MMRVMPWSPLWMRGIMPWASVGVKPSRFMPVSTWMAAPPFQPVRRQNMSHSASSLRSPITGRQLIAA